MDISSELDPPFSSPDAAATDWTVVHGILESAETSWLTTVRADGRPHDGEFHHGDFDGDHPTLVFEVTVAKVLSFDKGGGAATRHLPT